MRYRASALLLSLLLAAAARAEEGHGEDPLVIPEPMVFDLVLALGPHRGEGEVNALVEVPLDSDHDVVDWAPEVEVALTDSFALEFELPFEDGDLVAYKLAGQATFGTAFDGAYIHGTQAIVEREKDFDLWELTFLYLAGVRFDDTWSTLVMLGFRTDAGDDAHDVTEAIFNFALFADVSDRLVLGFEADLADKLGGDATLLFMPQVHWGISHHWELQAGAGVDFLPDDEVPLASARLIWEF